MNLSKSAIKQTVLVLVSLWMYVSFGVIRSYVALLFYQLELPEARFHLNDDQKTWIATCAGLLSPLTSLTSGYLMDVLGRKKCAQLMFVPFLISWIVVSLSANYQQLLIGILIQSVGSGMGICTITYISEVTPAEYRGLLFALIDLFYNLGGVLCDILMYFWKWYTVSEIFALFTCASIFLAFMLPESPLWLYLKGEKDNAVDILCALRGKTKNELADEISNLEKSCSTKSNKTGLVQTIKNCFSAWKQFSIASLCFILVVLSGPLFIQSYIVIVLDRLEIPFDSSYITVIYSIACIVGSLIYPFIILKCQRKTVMGISAIGMTLSMLIIGIYEEISLFYFKNEKHSVWIIPMAFYFYGILYSMGVLPIAFIIGSELFPLESRGTLQGIFGSFVTLSWTISLKFYPLVLFNFGVHTLIWTFCIFCFILMLFVILVLPETKDKTLVEIQEEYFGKTKKNATRA